MDDTQNHAESMACHDSNTATVTALTGTDIVVIFANMPAELIHRFRDCTAQGHLIEMVVWRVPAPVQPTTHGLKYRLAYIVDGQRVVGFDNERGKGDHCHLDGQEQPYVFVSLEQLIDDFIREVDRRRTP